MKLRVVLPMAILTNLFMNDFDGRNNIVVIASSLRFIRS